MDTTLDRRSEIAYRMLDKIDKINIDHTINMFKSIKRESVLELLNLLPHTNLYYHKCSDSLSLILSINESILKIEDIVHNDRLADILKLK